MSISPPRKILSNGVPDVQRLITTHDQDGKAVYSDAVDDDAKWQQIKEADRFNFSLRIQLARSLWI